MLLHSTAGDTRARLFLEEVRKLSAVCFGAPHVVLYREVLGPLNEDWGFYFLKSTREAFCIWIPLLLIMPVHRRQPSIELLEFMGVVKENGNEQTSLPPVHTPLSYDYVLVAKTTDGPHREAFKKQNEYIEELKKKHIRVTKIIDDDLVFYGIQAPKEIFEKYRYLLKVSDACNWSSDQNVVPLSTRIRIVHFILNHTSIRSGECLRDLMKIKVFEAKFCLHEKKKQRELKESWARWTACLQGQPITAVRFGLQHNSLFITPLFTLAVIAVLLFSCHPTVRQVEVSAREKQACHHPHKEQTLFELVISHHIQGLMHCTPHCLHV